MIRPILKWDMRNIFLSNCFLITGILVVASLQAAAQNINIPNKTGPMGLQVNTLTGNLYYYRQDLLIPARGLDFNIGFHYNSFAYLENDGYGNGWTFNYHILYNNDSLGGKTIRWGDGREDYYTPSGPASFNAPKGFFDQLEEYQPGKWRITQTDGTKFFFDNSMHRRITRMEDANGNYIAFSYADTLLVSLTNGAGQSITLSYNNGRLTSINDALASPARSFTYSYDAAGNLTEVKDPLNNSTRYSYLINGPMKSVTDKNNNKVDIVYLNNFALSEMIGCNKRISFSYDTSSLRTLVTDYLESGNNQVSQYDFKRQEGKKWLSAISGNCCGFEMKFEFDAAGNKISETDANGNTTRYTYDARGNMLTITDPLNNTQTFTYTSDFNKPSSFKDRKGAITSMNYDSRGNLLQITEPGNLVYTATYNTNGDITSSTDPKGNTFTYNYDALGNPLTVTGPNGYSAQLAYDARGNLLSFTDAKGNSSSMEFDILNRLKKITDPLSHSVQLGYDAAGNLISFKNQNNESSSMAYDASNRLVESTDEMGGKTIVRYDAMNNIKSIRNALGYEAGFEYDNRNRLQRITDPEGNTLTADYDARGNLTQLRLPDGQILNYTYDALNRLVSVSDAVGIIINASYDKNGNIISRSNASGATYTAEYDALNRIKKITDPLGKSYNLTYDNNNNIVAVTDRSGFTSTYTYDSLNRMKTVTDYNGNTVSITYDLNSNIASLSDENNNTTSYTYDPLNRLIRTTFPDGRYLENSYDNKSNLITRRLADGSLISFGYDSLNRVVSKTLPGGNTYSYAYDALGRMSTATNSEGTVSFSYDVLNRVITESFNGRTIRYTYNISGRTQSIIYPDSTLIVKTYDTRNRLTSITKNNQLLVSYQYNTINQLTSKLMGNGTSTSYQYDIANRLSNIFTAGGTIQNSSFSYNNNNHKTSISRLNNPARSEQFTYDNGRRLTNYKRGPMGGTPLVENSYTYDALGNRVSASFNGVNTSYSSNNLNQLLSSNNGTQTINFTFDNNGNLLFDGRFHKTYDAEGRLLKDSASPINVITYGYDALNRRVRRNANGISVRYGFSGFSLIEEINPSNGSLLSKTVFSDFLGPVVNEKNGQQYFYHQNEMNSVEAISNQFGRVLETYEYDAYGSMKIYDSLNNPINSSLTGNHFGFTGQLYDSATRTYKFFFRDYNPETGLFNQRDLVGYADGMGMYQYVHNNPANGIDVLGLNDCDEQKKSLLDQTEWLESYVNGIISSLDKMSDYTKTADKLKLAKTLANDAKVFKGAANVMDQMGLLDKALDFWIKGDALADASKALNNSNSVKLLGGFKDFAKGAGNALNVADVSIKGFKFKQAVGDYMNGNIDGYQLTKSGGNLGQSALGFSGVGGLYNLFDFAQEKLLTGQSMNDNAEYAGQFYGELYSNMVDNQDWKTIPLVPKKNGIGFERDPRFMEMRRRIENKVYRRKADCPQNNGGGTQRPSPINGSENGDITEAISSFDPNEIIGPDGMPDKNWVSVNDRLPYTVTFENDKSATAPAKYVKIIVPIHPKMNPASFQLGSFGFNSLSFTVPPASASYYQRLDCRDSLGLFVDVIAGYDIGTNQAFWEFQSIDPLTLLPPADPLKGFLLLQDSSSLTSGHGFVNFSIKPVSNANTLDTILARADIVFDNNDTIPTNVELNTIDALPPVSNIAALPATSINTEIDMVYTGADDVNGSGVKSYSIFISDNNAAPELFVADFSGGDTSFIGLPGHQYKIYLSAKDSVGNTEALRLVDSVFVLSGENTICPNGNIVFDSKMSGAVFQWQVDMGSGFVNISNGGIYAGANSAILQLSNAPTSMYGYRYRCMVNGSLYSTTFLLKFGMKWEGTISSDWFNPANWTCGTVPDENTDVIIEGGKFNYPVIGSDVSVRSFRLNSGASVTVNPGVTITIRK